MNPKIMDVYQKTLDLFYEKFRDSYKAWDSYVEFLAVDHNPYLLKQMEHKFEWFFNDKDFAEKVIKVYDPKLLKTDRYDYLGDLYVENQSRLSQSYKGQFLTPPQVVDFMTQMAIGEKTEKELNILDPAVGTGRFLISAYQLAPKANLFGVDIDLRALRVAMTNCAIHNIPAYLLHADSLYHEIDISKDAGWDNWQYANRWHSCWDELKTIGDGEIKKEEKIPKALLQAEKKKEEENVLPMPKQMGLF